MIQQLGGVLRYKCLLRRILGIVLLVGDIPFHLIRFLLSFYGLFL